MFRLFLQIIDALARFAPRRRLDSTGRRAQGRSRRVSTRAVIIPSCWLIQRSETHLRHPGLEGSNMPRWGLAWGSFLSSALPSPESSQPSPRQPGTSSHADCDCGLWLAHQGRDALAPAQAKHGCIIRAAPCCLLPVCMIHPPARPIKPAPSNQPAESAVLLPPTPAAVWGRVAPSWLTNQTGRPRGVRVHGVACHACYCSADLQVLVHGRRRGG